MGGWVGVRSLGRWVRAGGVEGGGFRVGFGWAGFLVGLGVVGLCGGLCGAPGALGPVLGAGLRRGGVGSRSVVGRAVGAFAGRARAGRPQLAGRRLGSPSLQAEAGGFWFFLGRCLGLVGFRWWSGGGSVRLVLAGPPPGRTAPLCPRLQGGVRPAPGPSRGLGLVGFRGFFGGGLFGRARPGWVWLAASLGCWVTGSGRRACLLLWFCPAVGVFGGVWWGGAGWCLVVFGGGGGFRGGSARGL